MGEPDKLCWRTPTWIIERFGPFDLDAAASKENAVCERYIDKAQDTFKVVKHADRVWLNPPYERNKIGRWLFPIASNVVGSVWKEVYFLVPASVSAKWFRNAAHLCEKWWLFDHRVSFIHPKTGKPKNGNSGDVALFLFSNRKHEGFSGWISKDET